MSPLPSNLRRRFRRVAAEIHVSQWPLLAAVAAHDVGRLLARLPPTPHSNTRVRRSSQESLAATMDWLARAQDATPDGGVSAYYALYGGFGKSYPETTGYIVPTMLRYAALTDRTEFRDRALRATAWLQEVQLPTGAFPGGFGGRDDGPSVFNSGQILFGLVEAHRCVGDPALEVAARRTGAWIAGVQHPDGFWERYTYDGHVNASYAMVTWALAELFTDTGDEKIKVAAGRNIEWTLAQQTPDGFFANFSLGGRPIYLHFIAYAIQGLLEASRLVGSEAGLDGAVRAGAALMRRFELDKRLAGANEPGWKAGTTYECVTGNAQMALVWQRLSEMTGDLRYFNAALKMNERIKNSLLLRGPDRIRGAVKGSDPVWGRYLWLRYPNWAAKFAADSLMNELTMLAQLQRGESVSAFQDDAGIAQ